MVCGTLAEWSIAQVCKTSVHGFESRRCLTYFHSMYLVHTNREQYYSSVNFKYHTIGGVFWLFYCFFCVHINIFFTLLFTIMKIEVLITWWTIDSYFDASHDSVATLEKTCVPDYINSLKTNNEYIYTEICMKDSREISLEDLKKLLSSIQESEANHFLITHGTYTMPDTARYLESHLKWNDKKIILVGSMIPLTGFSPSDAWFNLWFAIWNLPSIEPWVYVGMNWSIFGASEASKLISDWRFVSLFNN